MESFTIGVPTSVVVTVDAENYQDAMVAAKSVVLKYVTPKSEINDNPDKWMINGTPQERIAETTKFEKRFATPLLCMSIPILMGAMFLIAFSARDKHADTNAVVALIFAVIFTFFTIGSCFVCALINESRKERLRAKLAKVTR